MGLMDAYLLTRARRLNVLIQPNLRFFHELFGWEVELARKEAEDARVAREAQAQARANAGEGGDMPMLDGQDPVIPEPRRITYSWPAFCRDLVSGVDSRGRTVTEVGWR
jgi:dual specificity MAP kinase phosphatase